jgi:hypothetical protein
VIEIKLSLTQNGQPLRVREGAPINATKAVALEVAFQKPNQNDQILVSRAVLLEIMKFLLDEGE